MHALFPLLLLLGPPINRVDQFAQLMARTKSLSVQMQITATGAISKANATFAFAKPDRFAYRLTWPPKSHTIIKNSLETLEYTTPDNIYDLYTSHPGFQVQDSELSGLLNVTFPAALLNGNLKNFVPPSSPFKRIKVEGSSETYRSEWTSRQGTGRLTVMLGRDGRLLRYETYSKTEKGVQQFTTTFSDYVFNASLPAQTFRTVPPVGYKSYSLPLLSSLLEIGQPLKLGRWMTASGAGNLDASAAGKLLVITQSDSPHAQQTLSALKGADLPMDIMNLSLDTSGGDAWSPPGAVRQNLGSLGTPLMILLDTKGTILGIWLGYSPDDFQDTLKEIIAAANGGDE